VLPVLDHVHPVSTSQAWRHACLLLKIPLNELDPPYEEEVDGWFGGVLRMLEALWEFICAVVSAIAEAVMAALSFLVDLIVAIVTSIFDTIVAPIVNAFMDWTESVVNLFARHWLGLDTPAEIIAAYLTHLMFWSGLAIAMMAMVVGLMMIDLIKQPFTGGLAFLTDMLVGILVGLLIGAFLGALLPVEDEEGEVGLIQDLIPEVIWAGVHGMVALSEAFLLTGIMLGQSQHPGKYAKSIVGVPLALAHTLKVLIVLSCMDVLFPRLVDPLAESELGEDDGKKGSLLIRLVLDIVLLYFVLHSKKITKGTGGTFASLFRITWLLATKVFPIIALSWVLIDLISTSTSLYMLMT
jgi:hypothetical protein